MFTEIFRVNCTGVYNLLCNASKKKDWIEGGGQSGDCTDICLIKEVHKMLMTKFYSG